MSREMWLLFSGRLYSRCDCEVRFFGATSVLPLVVWSVYDVVAEGFLVRAGNKRNESKV